MVQANGVVVLVLYCCTLFFGTVARSQSQKIQAQSLLSLSFFALLAAAFFAIIEEFFQGNLFNLLEHSAYLFNAVLLCIWCFRIPHRQRGVPRFP